MPFTTTPTRLLLTPGEPAGIGPDVTIQMAQTTWPVELVAIADPALLSARAKQLDLPLRLRECDLTAAPHPNPAGTLSFIPISLQAPTKAGELNEANAAYVLNTLALATDLCQQQVARGIITGPVHKGIINQAGEVFTGHTEFFAKACHVTQTVMLFVVDQLKVACATTHLPLKDVPAAITPSRLRAVISTLRTGLQKQFHIQDPHIFIAGLNPHAGENGYLGREEIDIIQPTIQELRKENYQLTGPLPADSLFTPTYLHQADAMLTMYHDQGLPVIKYAGFDRAVNVTLGLPFIRTSVDHGTALDLAGTGLASANSLKAAIQLAIELSVCQ